MTVINKLLNVKDFKAKCTLNLEIAFLCIARCKVELQNVQVTWTVNNLLCTFRATIAPFSDLCQAFEPHRLHWMNWPQVQHRIFSSIPIHYFEMRIVKDSRGVWLWMQLILREGWPLPGCPHSCGTSVTPEEEEKLSMFSEKSSYKNLITDPAPIKYFNDTSIVV